MYLVQKTDYDCGPIALLNYLMWEGFDASEKDLKLVRKMVQTTKKGTQALNVYAAVMSMNPDTAFCIGMKGWGMSMKHIRTRPLMIAYNVKTAHILFAVSYGKKVLLTNFTKNGHVVMTKKALKAFLKNSITSPIFILC